MELEQYNRWLERELEDAELTAELKSIEGDKEEIFDRFCMDLEFGTGGLRGILGAGTNRMNIYTVRRATQGMAEFVLSSGGNSAAIAHDSRIKGALFAREAACVFAANGITVHMYRELAPTPMLSYAVRTLGCTAGVNITASHNPAKYNGYKAYGPDGCQLTTEGADDVLSIIRRTDVFEGARYMPFDEAVEKGLIRYIGEEVIDSYMNCVLAQRVRPQACVGTELSVVFTPLNGAGNRPVREMLRRLGVTEVHVVPEQEQPDGNFPTCPNPNPELPAALELGLALCAKTGADLLIATDPDCDRVGVAVKTQNGIKQLSGNEIGVLLLDYIAAGRRENGTMPESPIAASTIVSTKLARDVANQYGVELVSLLTGFKWIGELIGKLEAKGEEGRFLFGFEESFGYLSGTYVRDKDAVVGAMLLCELAAHLKKQGKTLTDAMEELYERHGFYGGTVLNFAFEGAQGMMKMKRIMDFLRANHPCTIADFKVSGIADYQTSERISEESIEAITLPTSNVLEYTLENGATVIIRPSGTEPKIKAYIEVKGRDRKHSEELCRLISGAVSQVIKE